MIVLKLLSLIIWLLIIPFCIGLLPVFFMKEKERTPGVIFISGYFVMFALFEIIGIPIVIMVVYHSFAMFSNVFAIGGLLLSAAGVAVTLINRKKGYRLQLQPKADWKAISLEEKICFLIFLTMVGFQMYMAFTRASFDGDDAYYGVQGVIAQQMDSLYRINPNTGRSAPLDVRHALALIPVWEAFVGRMSGIHATIIAHSVVPLVLIPLTYLVYFQIGKKLLSNKKDMLPMFMIVMSLLQMFGNVSIYTNETFFLTRTWQGKSLAGNFVLPAVFWIFLCLFERTENQKKENSQSASKKQTETGLWMLLACINLTAGVSSSLAVLLSAALVAGLALLFALKEKKFSILVKAGLTCLPSAAYVLTYLALVHL